MSKNRGNSQRIQHRRGSAAEWTVNNPILFAGELGYETDTTRIKFGDGVTQWVNLAYVGQFGASDLDSLTDVSITSPASGAVLRYDGASWIDAVLSKSDVGLSNVDNTSDANKPVSTAQAAADAAVASAASSDATSKANAAQAAAIQRANHTGTQPASTITGLATVATSNSYTDLSNRPATFPPSVHTHTVSQVTDAGTIATQNANSVAITGGSINGTTIGATTASTGRFTTVEAAGADAAILVGTGSYGRFQLSGGNATGFLFGSFAALGDGVHLAYNYYANAAGTGVITNALGPTSRVTVGYGFVAFATSSAINTAPTERVRIDGSGNVGIGTTGPTANLHVASASDATMRLSRTSGATLDLLTTASAGFVNVSSNHNLVLRTNNTDRVFVDTSGNVGIGTASPGAKLHVAGSGQGIFIEDTGANRAVLGLYAFNNELRIQGTAYVNAAQPLTVWTANAERMRIDANGNVGIGTTSPSARLDVRTNTANDGILLASSTSNLQIRALNGQGANNGIVQANDSGIIYTGGTVNTGAFVIAPWNNATCGLRMDANGNVGIGTVSPTTRLDVAAVSTIASGTWAGGTDFVRLLAASGSAFSEQAIAFQEAGTNVGAKIGVKNQGNGAYDIVFANRDNSSLTSAFAERARITAAGNVGIGTVPHPSAKLHVQGGQIFHATTDFVVGSTGTVIGTGHGAATGNTYGFIAATNVGGTAWSNLVLQSGGGNVGIGTTSPTISSGVGLHLGGSTLRIGTARTPASSTATGNQGEVCWDTSYLYVCIATNTWRRIALTTW